MTFNLCAPSAIPGLGALQAGLTSALAGRGLGSAGTLMTLRDPIFSTSLGTYRNPELEGRQLLQEVQAIQNQVSPLGIIQPIVKYLNLIIGSIIPRVPGTSISVIDLLDMNPEALYQSLSTSSLYQGYMHPAIEQVHRAQVAAQSARQLTHYSAYQMINAALAAIGAPPYVNPILAGKLYPTIDTALAVVRAGGFSIPGFSAPEDILRVGTLYQNPQVDQFEQAKLLVEAALRGPLTDMLGICSSVLGFLHINPPLVCVPITIAGEDPGQLLGPGSWVPNFH